MPDKFITLPQLTKAVKGLVNRVNTEITMTDSKIGDLSNLTTSATGNLVAAINEAASSSSGDLSGYVQSQVGNDGTLYEDFIGSVIQHDNSGIYLGHLDSVQGSEASITINQSGLRLVSNLQPITIEGLAIPSSSSEAANKQYVDQKFDNITHPVTSVNGATGAVVLNIPAAQVNSDWNATSGVAQILNKPTIPEELFESGSGTNSIQQIQNNSAEQNNASGDYSIALGRKSVASGQASIAIGNKLSTVEWGTTAGANGAIAIGASAKAAGALSVAIGQVAQAEDSMGFAFGNQSDAKTMYSVAIGNRVISSGRACTVLGQANLEDANPENSTHGAGARKYLFIIGNGLNDSNRSNALTVDWDGNLVTSGKITVGTAPTANMDITTKQYVDNAINGITIPVTSVNGATGAVTLNYVPKVTTGSTGVLEIATGANGDSYSPGIHMIGQNIGSANLTFSDGSVTLSNNYETGNTLINNEIILDPDWSGIHITSYDEDTPQDQNFIDVSVDSISIGSTTTAQNVAINNLANPTTAYQAAHKKYVDDKFSAITYPVTSVNGATGAVTITATGIGALPDSTVIPTKTSDLTNDSKYLSGDINSQTNKDNGYIIFRQASSLQTGLTKSLYIGSTTNNNQFLQIGRSHTDDGIKGQIQLSNEAYSSGYTTITPSASYNITITLPNTTGTLALTSQVVSSVNGSTGTVIIDKIKTTAPSNNVEYNLMGTTSNNNTTAVSSYNQDLLSFAKTNDLSRLTIGSTATPGVVRVYTSAVNGTGFTDIKSNASSTNERTITLPDASGTVALTTDIPNVPSWALANNKPSYTFSELTSHPTTLNDYGITDAYTKTEVDGLVSGVLHYKGAKSTTGALPSSGNTTGDVWHITADGSEWAWDGSTWQELGTAVDLSGYLQTGDIAAWAKAANKPSYTASEVGALPSSTSYVSSFNGATGAITYTPPVTSVNGNTGAVTITAASITAASATHAHGNLTSGGDITTTATIASGDRLVINDESASKITNSSITFGSSTTQYLANNGTWQNVPTSYDDTALAARVTALEQIPWVTYYTGSTTPSNAQGNNGDLYFQTAQ